MGKTKYTIFKGYKFKLIPFIISLLIVITITFAAAHYTLFLDENLKITYMYDELETLNASTSLLDDQTRIEKYIHFNSNYYQKITDNVRYYDARKAKVSTIENALIGETPTKTSQSFTWEGTTFKDGVLHVGEGDEHLFDMMLYAECTNINKSNVLNYYFIMFNINYSKINPDKLGIIYCNNYALDTKHNYVIGDEKLSLVLDEYRNHYFDDKNGVLSNGCMPVSTTAFDKSFVLNDIHGSNSNNPIHSFVTFSSSYVYGGECDSQDTKNISLSELEKATFSIVNVLDDTNEASGVVEYQEIMRGDLVNEYEDGDDFVKKAENNEDIKKGYNDVIVQGLSNYNFKTKEYRQYVSKDVVKAALIFGAISLVIAFIFYTIWQDDSYVELPKKIKRTKKR